MSDNKSDKTSVKDLIRLKHEINKDIKYSGLNAQEVVGLENLSSDQYKDVQDSITTIKKSWWFLPDALMFAGAVIGNIGYWYFHNKKILAGIFIGTAIYCAGQLVYRQGVYYGFRRGFEDGHVMGVRKVLKIDDDEAADIHDLAIEMQIDERLINRFDDTKK